MWKSSNSNSSFALWPPEAAQKHKSSSFFYPTYTDNNGWLSLNASGDTFPGFGAHGRSFPLNSAFSHQLNPQSLNPLNGSFEKVVDSANGCLGVGCAPQMKRFLIFDQSGDRTNLIFSSVGNPEQAFNPILPTTDETYAYVSDCHEIEEHDEMHEDTEEIDALLYSDSENSYDLDEESTGHSPPGVEEEAETSSPAPSKRRKTEHYDLGTSFTDTASSAVVPSRHFVNDNDDDDGDDAELSYVYSGSKMEDNAGEKVMCSKRERIQTTVDLLRRIIPGGNGKDTAAVLDDAIQYLKSLKLQAEALGLHLD